MCAGTTGRTVQRRGDSADHVQQKSRRGEVTARSQILSGNRQPHHAMNVMEEHVHVTADEALDFRRSVRAYL